MEVKLIEIKLASELAKSDRDSSRSLILELSLCSISIPQD